MNMMKTGHAREIITPTRGVSLAGYFNQRYNRGILDNLYVKTVLFENNGEIGGIVSFDLIYIPEKFVEELISKLEKKKINFAKKLLFCAIHTHTGPNISRFMGEKDKIYYKRLIEKTVLCIKEAFANLSESEISYSTFKNNPLAFNRRYFMKDKRVLTNPGKLNSDIVHPEGPVDNEIGVIALEKDGKPTALLVNIINHTDTIGGGDMVSADWPGQLEKAIQDKLGYEIDVITLIGCSGNINHFDVKSKHCQSNYDETKKMGQCYARLVVDNLKKLKKISSFPFRAEETRLVMKTRRIRAADEKKARRLVSEYSFTPDHDLSSEDLIKNTGAVVYYFADQLLKFKKNTENKTKNFSIITLKFGKELAVTSLPGEPFTEIGMKIKEKSPFKKTFVVSNSMGNAGYIPMPDCFNRGGYEILPTESGGCREDTANVLIKKSLDILSE